MSDLHGTHVAIDDLAAYAAGELDGAAAVGVEAHVLLCAECRRDLDGILATTDALAALGDEPPPAMPADIAARIDTAIAAERERGGSAAATVVPLDAKRRRTRTSLASGVAAAAALALVAVVGLGMMRSGMPQNDGNRAGVAARELRVEQRRIASGTDYTNADIPAVTQALLSGQAAPVQGDARSSAEGVTPPGSSKTAGQGATPAAVTPNAFTMDSSATLGSCVEGLRAGQTPVVEPVLIDERAVYQGQPALLVVLPTIIRGELQPGSVDVWIVGAACRATDTQLRAFYRVKV